MKQVMCTQWLLISVSTMISVYNTLDIFTKWQPTHKPGWP
jgi:hypothetical protein